MTEENKLWFEYGKALGCYLFARNDVLLEIKINKDEYERSLEDYYDALDNYYNRDGDEQDIFDAVLDKESLRYKFYRDGKFCKTYNFQSLTLRQLIIEAWQARNNLRKFQQS